MSEQNNNDGVVNDGAYANVFLSVGNSKDRTAYTTAIAPRILGMQELDNIYAGDGFARRIVDLPAEEMVRAGFYIEGVDGDEDVIAALENISTLPQLCHALRWSALFGGSLVVMLINDGGNLEEPLNFESVKSIEQLRVYDRWEVSHEQKYNDPSDSRFGKTQIYLISPSVGIPYRVHESRTLIFDGMPVSTRTRDRNDGWGASRIQQCWEQLTRLNMSHVWANALLERAQQAVHGIPELTNILRQAGGEALVRQRIDLVDMARSINNTVVIDAAESYDLKSTPLTGVPDLVDKFGIALSATSGIPESLLFGRQQGGLNSTGKSDLENWYAKVSQAQQTILLPAIDKIVTIQLYAMGKYTDDYLIKFNPLYVPSAKDKADTEYTEAKTFEIYNNIGALDASEVRGMLSDRGYEIDEVRQVPESEDVEDDV